ncbi:uncharacterized protein LOC118754005 [Rhagoletis pomonella]|uniref:uncharacterized protein LOC118754005 n=1 Tax=Rhagoletis pomonella TaxID=28610 RepID=UPI001781A7AD|nr:uncharacterized protein LOC118754005 [Rhagoletis pomonella]
MCTPRSNGLAEGVNQALLAYLKPSTNDPKDWDTHVRMLQWTMNTKINATTKFAPIDLVYDFPLRDLSGNKLFAALHDNEELHMNGQRSEAVKNIEEARQKRKTRFNAKHRKPVSYK